MDSGSLQRYLGLQKSLLDYFFYIKYVHNDIYYNYITL